MPSGRAAAAVTRALVTGGLGFLGSHLVDALLDEGADVTIVDDRSSAVADPESYAGRCRVEVSPIEAYVPAAPRFDEIYHLAERAGPAGILPYAGTLGLRSALGIERVLQLAEPHRTRLLYVSSSEVYGKPGRFAEDEAKTVPSPYTVRREYALAKLLGEATVLNAAAARDLAVNVVRPFNIAGPRQASAGGFVLPRFFEAALSGAPITVFGDGRQVRSLTHVADTVASLLAVMRSPVRGLVLNSGNPDNATTILDLAAEVREVCESRSPIAFVDPRAIYGPLYAEAFDKVPDVGRIAAAVGWTPRWSLAHLLRDAHRHYAERHARGAPVPARLARP